MPGLFIATRRLKQSRPPAGRCYPSAGLIGWGMQAVTAVASGFQRAAGKPLGARGPGQDHYPRDRSTRRRRTRDARSLLGESDDANQTT
jgi:hypothetical protein